MHSYNPSNPIPLSEGVHQIQIRIRLDLR